MRITQTMIRRNVKLFFHDKAMFLTSLITPLILLLLYTTFLGNVYRDSLVQNLPLEVSIPESVLDGLVGGQLISSILAVSCVTVAFCSNFLMVQDKVTGARKDLFISPIRSSTLSMSYYVATLISTLLICVVAAAASFVYLATVGWYLTALDVVLLFADVLLLVLFGTALSSIINFFLSTEGQISAVGSVVSSCYGFVCGAYMPLSTFGEGLRTVISFLPGTYGTSLLRNHAMRGALAEIEALGVPHDVIEQMRDALDCNLYFFGNRVSEPMMYTILGGAIALLIVAYIVINKLRRHV